MLRIIGEKGKNKIVSMREMEPLQIGEVVGRCRCIGDIVFKTPSTIKPQVINLTRGEEDECWSSPLSEIKDVRLLEPGEKIIVELFNE